MNDKDERTHQARQGSAPQPSGDSGASGTSGARRKRRRRGGRGRNQRARTEASRTNTPRTGSGAATAPPAAKQEQHKQQQHNQQPQGTHQSASSPDGGEAAAAPRRKQRRQGARRGGAKNSQRSGNRRGQRGGTQRRSARGGRGKYGNRRGAPSRRNAAVASQFDTRRETSAGGLVVSGLAEAVAADGSVDLSRVYVALIGRLDRRRRLLWSMPKGHVEPGEEHRATAQREVWEETGIRGEVFAELGVIDYWFVSEGVRIHKTVHHHLLRYVDGYLNDEDPEVTEVSWIPVHQLIEHLAYADERKLARVAHDILPDLARAEKRAGRRTPR